MGGIVVVCLVLLAILAPVIAPWDPNRPDIKKILDAPSNTHPLGTDQLGRDVLSRMLYGARVSLAVGFVSVGIASLIGVMLGSLAGYNGGLVDAAIMRLVDLMLVFPRFFLLLAVLAFLRPSIWTIMAVIGLTGWMGVARLVRAEFLALKEREFVVWSQAVGASGFRIVWRHILPNAMAPVLVAMTLGIPAAILTESGLSFLGLGVQPPPRSAGGCPCTPGSRSSSRSSRTTSSARGSATRSTRACGRAPRGLSAARASGILRHACNGAVRPNHRRVA